MLSNMRNSVCRAFCQTHHLNDTSVIGFLSQEYTNSIEKAPYIFSLKCFVMILVTPNFDDMRNSSLTRLIPKAILNCALESETDTHLVMHNRPITEVSDE